MGRADDLYPVRSVLTADGRYLFLIINEMSSVAQIVADPVFPVPASGYLVKLDLQSKTRRAFPLTGLNDLREDAYLLESYDHIDVTPDGRYVLLSGIFGPLVNDAVNTSSDDAPAYRIDTEANTVQSVNYMPSGTRFDAFDYVTFLGGPEKILFPDRQQFRIRDYIAGSVVTLPWNNSSSIARPGRQVSSRDGSRFVFMSETNITNAPPPPDAFDPSTFDGEQAYLYDLSSQQAKLLSHTPTGTRANSALDEVVLSADGKHALFTSNDESLDPLKNSGFYSNIYHHDLDADKIEHVVGSPVDTPDVQADLAISSDGAYFAYSRKWTWQGQERTQPILQEMATGRKIVLSDLIQNPHLRTSEYFENTADFSFSDDGQSLTFIWRGANDRPYGGVYLYDIPSGTLRDIVEEFDLFESSQIRNFAASANGSKVVFNTNEILSARDRAHSKANDTVFGTMQVYLADLTQTAMTEISVKTDGSRYARKSGDHALPYMGVDISDDGSVAIFASHYRLASDGYEDTVWPTNRERVDVFMKRPGDAGTVLISHSLGWYDDVVGMAISGDGRTIGYATQYGLYIHDVQSNTAQLVRSVRTPNYIYCTDLDFSRDGSILTYKETTYEDRLGLDALFIKEEIIRYDRSTAEFRVLRTATGETDFQGGAPAVSSDGRYTAFCTRASLAPTDGNATNDIYRYDSVTGGFELVSALPDGSVSPEGAIYPSMSGDGRFVSFSSRDADFATGVPQQTRNVFLRDIDAATTASISRGASTGARPPSNDLSFVSGDGSRVFFRSFGQGVVEGANPYSSNLFFTENPFNR